MSYGDKYYWAVTESKLGRLNIVKVTPEVAERMIQSKETTIGNCYKSFSEARWAALREIQNRVGHLMDMEKDLSTLREGSEDEVFI